MISDCYSSQEESWILDGISPEASNLRRAEFLIAQLPSLILCYRSLHQPILQEHQAVLKLLWDSIHHKKELIVRTILETLANLPDDPTAIAIAQQLGQLAPSVLVEALEKDNWSDRLSSEISACLKSLQGQATICQLDYSAAEIWRSVETLLDDQNPLIQTACLYITAQLDLNQTKAIAPSIYSLKTSTLLQETTKIILSASEACPSLSAFPMLEKIVHLFNSDFFNRMHSETLISLANCAEVRTYTLSEVITEAGDTCRELLIVIAGSAKINIYVEDQVVRTERLHIGQTLDELEILARSDSQNTIIADSEITRILAIPVDAFDDFLDRDRDFARRVLELESRQLQKFMRSLQTVKLI